MFDGVKAEQRAKEKNERWIKELEARDREEKEEREIRIRRLRGEDGKGGVGVAKSVLERSEERWRRRGGVLGAVKGLGWS